MRSVMMAAVVLWVAAACGSSEPPDRLVIDRPPAEQARSMALTLEEAGLLASGALRMWVGTPDEGEDDAAVLRALRTDP